MSYTYDYPRPMLTTDCVLFRKSERGLQVLLIKRLNDPYKDCWAFPGGFLEMDEELEVCARRELLEETGILPNLLFNLGVYGKVGRDPRGRVITIAYWGVLESDQEGSAGDDAAELEWYPVDKLPELAFDHQEMFENAKEEYLKSFANDN